MPLELAHRLESVPSEEARLLALLEGMIAAGVRPDSFLVMRLADGRVKVLSADGPDVRTVSNQYGAVTAAYRVGCRERDGRIEPVLEVVYSPYRGSAAGLCKNSAIFAASFGMTAGALP